MSGGSDTTTKQTPTYDPVTAAARQRLWSILSRKTGVEGPGYGNISKAFEALMSTTAGKGIMPYQSDTIKQMIETGAPFSQTEVFKTAEPVYKQNLEKALAQAKESAGMGGSVRGTAGEEGMAHAAGSELNEFMKYMTGMASASHEAAQGRRMEAIPYGFEEAMLPGQMAGQSANIELARNPYLKYLLQMILGSQPGATAVQTTDPGFDIGGWMSGLGSMALGAAAF